MANTTIGDADFVELLDRVANDLSNEIRGAAVNMAEHYRQGALEPLTSERVRAAILARVERPFYVPAAVTSLDLARRSRAIPSFRSIAR